MTRLSLSPSVALALSLSLRAFSVKGTQDKSDQKKKNPDNMDQGHMRIYILQIQPFLFLLFLLKFHPFFFLLIFSPLYANPLGL